MNGVSVGGLAAKPVFCDARDMQRSVSLVAVLFAFVAAGAELRFDFSETKAGQYPAGFTNLLAGVGRPGDWQVVMDEVTPLLAPLTPQAPDVTRRAVLGQLSPDATDERFPLLAYVRDSFGDFTLKTRFKIVSGEAERMAGIAFRMQDEKNFYVIRASSLGRNVRFYKMVNGVRSQPIGTDVEVKAGEWHELTIRCKGSEIQCELNGKVVLPPLNDLSFRAGRVAFWTKSDSVSYFADTVIDYTPQIPLGQRVVDEAMGRSPRLLELKLVTQVAGTNATHIIASKDKSEIGKSGGQYEAECLKTGQIFFSKNSSHAAVVMPVRDRNGEVIAAARLHMTTFPGQTERNAVIRATPIVKDIEARIRSQEDPLE
jgi:hypothetical protein